MTEGQDGIWPAAAQLRLAQQGAVAAGEGGFASGLWGNTGRFHQRASILRHEPGVIGRLLQGAMGTFRTAGGSQANCEAREA